VDDFNYHQLTGMKTLSRPAKCIMKYKLFLTVFGLLFVRAAWATIPLYQNQDVLLYTIPNNPPPQIDALAFDNENSFTIAFSTFNPGTPFYETMNTLFYTNTGVIVANSPAGGIPNVLLSGLGFQNFGCGYNFDLQNNNHLWADTFYNPGTIRAVSTLDGNGLFFNVTFFGSFFFTEVQQLGSYGEVLVSATNIINPGTVDVSVSGLINLTGGKVDLSNAKLTVEGPLNFFGTLTTANFSGVGAVGTDTNGDWNPAADLATNAAISSFVPVGPGQLVLANSQCYFDQKQSPPGSTNYIINRYVFVENVNTNVPYKVYISDPDILDPLAFEPGAAHVEWDAGYTDPGTGNTINNFLYLTCNYALGATTNDLVLEGKPESFQFTTSPTPLLTNSQPIYTQPLTNLPDAFMSNNYACFFGSLVGSTVGTNVSTVNPHGTITNLTGQIYINAKKELNLAFTTITGPNYLNLSATNQFDGSPGAAISVPYSDIALGVTNGFLTFSNVLMAQIPNFSGPIDAWSSDWIAVDASGVTNEYKVLLVYSDLLPSTPPWTQNMYLHGTNTLDVSDPLNVYGSFYSDARILVLNTNQTGVGATSFEGTLNWLNPIPFNANNGSGLQQMPNLLWVTNSGSIQVLDSANFGNLATPQSGVIPGVPAVPAVGTLSETGTNAVFGDKVIIGTNTYAFVKSLTNTVANQILWNTTFNVSLNNLIAAINGATGSGTKYSTATKSNKFVSAGSLVNQAFTVTARTAGAAGNMIQTVFVPATVSSNLTWSVNAALVNGLDAIPPVTNYTAFINHSGISDQGTTIWTTYFENDGTVLNGTGSFILHSGSGMLTNGSIVAGGDVVLQATNTPGTGSDSLIISNHVIQAGRKLTLLSTNITDTGVTNGNIWVVGANSGGGSFDSGFNTLEGASSGDLLGTTVTNISPYNTTIYNVWAGKDYGISAQGYTNNLAVGHMVIDVLTTNTHVSFVYNSAGVSNALYIDLLELKDGATHGNATNDFDFPWLQINTNMFVYYARAVEDVGGMALDDSEAIDHYSRLGANGGRLRWIYSYAGYFSSTNVVYTNMDGSLTTNSYNTALRESTTIDSDSDGRPNAIDDTPFFVPAELNFMASYTNHPPKSVKVEWTTIPNATNFVYYATNLLATNWLPFTNFNYWYYGNNVAVTNSAHSNNFRSPQVYINNASLPDNSQQTNVWVFDSETNMPHYYKVVVWPWLNFPE